jgi:spore coat polysaccharide biosynthesis protein SpsF
MASTRLPGKVLKIFSNGLTMLDMQLNSLLKIFKKDEIYIATTTNKDDDDIENKYKGICKVYRGSEKDVLSRFLDILSLTNAKNIIRVSSDNPFIFYEGVKYLLNKHIVSNSDYTTFKTHNIPSMLAPVGLYAEIISPRALQGIKVEANDMEKEHVTYAVYNRLKKHYKINLIRIDSAYPYLNNQDYRFTVDTINDFQFVDNIINKLDIKLVDICILQNIITYILDKNLIENMKIESMKKDNKKD